MDWGSLGGILLAVFGILLGQAIEGGQISSLIQPAAFLIVVFGTFGAVLLQSKPANFKLGLTLLRWILQPPIDDRKELSRRIIGWSHTARRDGLLKLEAQLYNETDPFIKKGLRLLIDGIAADKIREICAIDIYYYESQYRSAAKIWDSAGGYAPTIGILGAVLGLIHVMENLSDPSRLGSGIAVAFVATIYGVGLANIVFLPIGSKLKTYVLQEASRREMLMNAWVSIAQGDHTRVVEERLNSYMR